MTKLYFAGAESEDLLKLLIVCKVDTLLYSYHNLRKKKDWKFPLKDNFLDSGAFSAMNSGVKINLKDYIEYIKSYKNITIYANLDVIGNAEATLKNQKYMESKGLKPLPVFHIREDFKYLEDYCEKYDYIAIGGVAQLNHKTQILSWLKKVFEVTERTNTKVHGFAVTRPNILNAFPFYSVDSTSWLSGGKYGQFYTFNNGKIKRIELNKTIKRKTKDWIKINYWNTVQWKKYADYLNDRRKKWNTEKLKSKT